VTRGDTSSTRRKDREGGEIEMIDRRDRNVDSRRVERDQRSRLTASSGSPSRILPRRRATYTDARTCALPRLRTCDASASAHRGDAGETQGRGRRCWDTAEDSCRDNCGLRVRERAPFARFDGSPGSEEYYVALRRGREGCKPVHDVGRRRGCNAYGAMGRSRT